MMFHCVDVALIPFSVHCENSTFSILGTDEFVAVSLTKVLQFEIKEKNRFEYL